MLSRTEWSSWFRKYPAGPVQGAPCQAVNKEAAQCHTVPGQLSAAIVSLAGGGSMWPLGPDFM